MLISCVAVSCVYEGESWCLYLCGLGGLIGALSRTSVVELRANRNVCISQCVSNECFVGNDQTKGCPYGRTGPKLQSNVLCKLCGACVKTCPHGALSLNLRLPGIEILEARDARPGAAFLVCAVIGGLLGELLYRLPLYEDMTSWWPVPPAVRFTVVFLAVVAAANAALAVASLLSSRTAGEAFLEHYTRHGLKFLPLALCALAAVHVYYIIHLGIQVPLVLSDKFGLEALGRLAVTVSPRFTLSIQILLVLLGLMWTLLIMYGSGVRKGLNLVGSLRLFAPHALLAICVASLLVVTIRSVFHGG
jgi:ferredoxin